MAIDNLKEVEFVDVLQRYLSPSSPINRVTALKGRAEQIDQIKKAFHSPGRHIFIHGDRGVGKSSLALAVGNYLSAEGVRPIQIACNGGSFFGLVRAAAQQMLGSSPLSPPKANSKVGLSAYGFGVTLENLLQKREVPEINDLNQAVNIIRYCADKNLHESVLIFDEFDAIDDVSSRTLFADFIKQIGDQRVPVKLFFTGIGKSLENLLTAHHSCYRYLASVLLEPLGWSGRIDIISAAAEALHIEVDQSSVTRIAAISDGFPHYVHLMCEKLFWSVFEDFETVAVTGPDHYLEALRGAVNDIEPFLRELYEMATQKYNNDYQEVLWAVADHHEFNRRSADIFQSYLEIMRQRNGSTLDRAKFNQRMNALKRDSHGAILVGSRQGWYELSEPILRGYIRLRAEHEGVQLAKEHPTQLGSRKLSQFREKSVIQSH